jgi:hypothetical protein
VLSRPFDIVVDRVVVGGNRLKGCRMGVGERAARCTKDVTQLQVVELPRRHEEEIVLVELRKGDRLFGHKLLLLGS